ncbi:hypothetical protein [Candidatus Manganitrophus noduliformans]|uniref:Uncharacterized protein n=1 Tax=Candidatus Manganitrophus noduliformans TaxID=2606439 RepID=A0A7X6IB83_9BACT|nr:hypothetical protein [Candidatus Manganitrophus noduliformans]NKE71516.1 hypothetical protein [Candidatus Manganitrophus noduliformans]
MRWLIRKMKNEAWPSSTRYILWGLLFFVAVGAIAACGGGGSKGSSAGAPVEVTPEQAAAGAADTVGGASKSLLGSIGKSVGNSSAAETILNALGIPPDPDPTANLEAQLGEAIALILENGQRTGDAITFDPDETLLCSDPLLGQVTLEGQPCIDFYSHITVVLTPGGNAEEGTLEIKYDNFVLATIDYSSGSVSLQLDLAQLKAIASAARPDVELPETLEGVVRATFTELGIDHAQFTFSIVQAINIVDAASDFNINIAATEKVFEFTADGPGGTLTAELGLGALNALFPVEDLNDVSFPTKLALNGATLHAALTAETLVITKIGINSPPPFSLDVDDPANSPNVDFSFGFVPFGVTLNGADDSITFDQEYNSDFAIEDVFGLFSPVPPGGGSGLTGTVNVVIPQGTKWTLRESTALTTEPIIRIEEGSATVTGDGVTFPSESLVAGDCFLLRPSFGFPLVSIPCIP